jgi:transcriptional regulator with XRE-family HTH domain
VSVPHPFAALLGDLRRAAGLTQLELAERAHIGVRTLRDLETGRALRPQRSTVDLLASALELGGDDRTAFVEAARGRTVPPQRPPS